VHDTRRITGLPSPVVTPACPPLVALAPEPSAALVTRLEPAKLTTPGLRG
jgi:hypothetical protein